MILLLLGGLILLVVAELGSAWWERLRGDDGWTDENGTRWPK